jgi:protoporphyrin/coproporphyrin ferrochelatase
VRGVLLINLGTPDAPKGLSVASYLNTFLCDPRVVELPYLLRQALVKGLIVPFRTAKTSAAYRSIWTPAGSPLRVHMRALTTAVQTAFTQQGDNTMVAMGMRYGKPSIQQGIRQLREAGCTSLHIIPLYPQYAAATTGSALALVLDILRKIEPILPFRVHPPFYQDPGFIAAFADKIRQHRREDTQINADTFTLFSYHGLPERQVRKMDARQCYRTQCLLTTTALVQAAGLDPARTATAFQSRVGRIPWTQPYLEDMLKVLAEKNLRRLHVVCPSFVVDCLETVEEIEIRAQKQWLALGGEHLSLVPSLQAHPIWVSTIMRWVMEDGGMEDRS